MTDLPADWERLRYYTYRCYSCGRLITRLEILRAWGKTGEKAIPLCPCGSMRVSPTNVTPEEYKRLGNWRQAFRYYVLRRRDDDTRLWELWSKEVAGKPNRLPEEDR